MLPCNLWIRMEKYLHMLYQPAPVLEATLVWRVAHLQWRFKQQICWGVIVVLCTWSSFEVPSIYTPTMPALATLFQNIHSSDLRTCSAGRTTSASDAAKRYSAQLVCNQYVIRSLSKPNVVISAATYTLLWVPPAESVCMSSILAASATCRIMQTLTRYQKAKLCPVTWLVIQ